MTKLELIGSYTKVESYIYHKDCNTRILFGTRKLVAYQKPLHYITFKPLSATDKPIYLSSLYMLRQAEYEGQTITTYRFDYKGIKYKFIDSATDVQIEIL